MNELWMKWNKNLHTLSTFIISSISHTRRHYCTLYDVSRPNMAFLYQLWRFRTSKDPDKAFVFTKIFTKFDEIAHNINYLSGFFLSNLEQIINIRCNSARILQTTVLITNLKYKCTQNQFTIQVYTKPVHNTGSHMNWTKRLSHWRTLQVRGMYRGQTLGM